MNEQGRNKKDVGGKNPLALFDGGSVSWDRPKEDIWVAMQDKLGERRPAPTISIFSRRRMLAAAALLILLLGIPGIMRFYTRTIVSQAGEHSSVTLPDGSMISMNAETGIKYKPLWWRFNREVRLDGEAFFEVEPGSTFTVLSDMASTQVVGTSFNILSRDKRYEVTCVSGKVKVNSNSSDAEVILEANQRASLLATGNLEMQKLETTEQSVSWINKKFFFTGAPLEQVFDEIEMQFNVKIKSIVPAGLSYTGNFSRQNDVSTVLEIVCKPFGIKFEALEDGVYLISENE